MAETSERFSSNTDHDIATMLEDKDSSSTKKPQSKRLKYFENIAPKKAFLRSLKIIIK